MSERESDRKISIFEYVDYRKFLKDAFDEAKSENSKFSLRYFSRQAGFKSHSVFRQVIAGQMNLSDESVDRFAFVFKLNKEETIFFRHLVLFNQAKTKDEKHKYAEQLLRSKTFKKTHPLSTLQFNYFTHWYFVPVRELIALKGFKEDPEWIASKLNPRIAPQEARKAIEDLQRLGLVGRDSNGKLSQATSNVSTGDEVTSTALTVFHREMLKKASEAIDRHPREKRDISFVSLGVSSETIKIIKGKIQKFRKELMDVAARSHDPDCVYQMNFQFFPLSDQTTSEEEK